jgi:SH3-like domain-containing protein
VDAKASCNTRRTKGRKTSRDCGRGLLEASKSWFWMGMHGMLQPRFGRWRSGVLVAGLWAGLWLVSCCAADGGALAQTAALDPAARTATGLPLPRFASLKVERVNLRQGPGTDYPTAWVFQRSGLPVEILREHEGWRQIRDADGTTGWVQGAALSGRRSAVVAPWDKTAASAPQPNAVRSDADDAAGAVAFAEANVVAAITSCDGRWCRIAIGDIRGFIEQAKLWGVYPGEVIK